MIDPLTEVVTLLQPAARFSKVVNGAGQWRVQRAEFGDPFYCVVLEGSSCLTVDGHPPLALHQGDFVLIPSVQGFTMSSAIAPPPGHFETAPVMLPNGEFRLGEQNGPRDVQSLVGHCQFASPDAALLVSLLPKLVHVRGVGRLTTLVQLVIDESRAQRPAREVVLSRLLEVMLIEALRSTAISGSAPGLVRGLADERLAVAIRSMHELPTHPWTVAQLAKAASLSRSAFFERFRRAMGIAPMEYLLAWRMALAKNLLREQGVGMAEIAQRVGYSSASAFSVAFTRYVGLPPARYAREEVTSH
ncbi:AraC family transcriptional regulator [Pantoea sp. BAV 3049]|uniref:AraC family transcriptional regulator n=1 Tax=Pantoea sp. BAV 3049 TaxID=2654188 RepID=UPI00131E25D8|nr:AraC family transcriptional regulator [Pantoea sp. BAV 3049]